MPAEHIVSRLPDIKAFGWAYRYINDSSLMPDLGWQFSSEDKNVDKNVNTTKPKYDL